MDYPLRFNRGNFGIGSEPIRPLLVDDSCVKNDGGEWFLIMVNGYEWWLMASQWLLQ